MPQQQRIYTDSGIEIKELYTANDIANDNISSEQPGEYPFTRGLRVAFDLPTQIGYDSIFDIQTARLQQLRQTRDNTLASNSLQKIAAVATDGTNLMSLVEAVSNYCTLVK
ncbi:Methylmalonyl-CoA mutase [Filimonas lacunae]|uniref:Methylmalonyl-CoA mutase n=1 Tax=Filimonas lacunae TaxID=477680 RepID=A0A173MK11_9BACT|nr:methylmalonyl-CoA mutase family protein [Filimonas lacunae]BAV07806.1 methylmalonyl-CoA mutase [Filimonas lacunae]SIT05026.1 Methylmalonyl-CoA mutase [Filimonas lacunae]